MVLLFHYNDTREKFESADAMNTFIELRCKGSMVNVSQILNHKCGANVSLISAQQIGSCFGMQAVMIGAVVTLMLTFLVVHNVRKNNISLFSGIAAVAMMVMATLLISRLSNMIGKQSKKTQQFELDELKKMGVSDQDAALAVFQENA